MLAALDDSGLAGDTLVIFVSDHGEMLGDHGLMLKGPMMYDGAVRVPLVMKWPDQLAEGIRVTDMVGTHDLARTVLAAANLDPLPGDEGLNLLDVASGERRGRSFAVCEYRDSGHPYDPPVHTTMYRTHEHKLVLWHGGVATAREQTGELYDLTVDPDELLNRWDDTSHQEVKARLLADLLDLWVSTEDRSSVREAPW